MAVVAEEAEPAEHGHYPLHVSCADLAHGRDFAAVYFGDVQQAAHLDRLVGDDDFARNRKGHQRNQCHDERREPRREVPSLVEIEQTAAQQGEDDPVDERPIERVAVETVFVGALHGAIFRAVVRRRSLRGPPAGLRPRRNLRGS